VQTRKTSKEVKPRRNEPQVCDSCVASVTRMGGDQEEIRRAMNNPPNRQNRPKRIARSKRPSDDCAGGKEHTNTTILILASKKCAGHKIFMMGMLLRREKCV